MGASGAGKSTLLKALAGVLGGAEEGTETGRLLVGGKHPTRRRGEIGLVLQDPESQVVLARVGDDVAFGLENRAVPPDQIWPRVRTALTSVGLGAIALDHSTAALSSGQLQRLALAGAVAMDTGLMLLDEPTANLDPAGVVEVCEAVAALVADRTRTLIVVDHRVDPWLKLVDRVIVLEAGGGVLAQGSPDRVFADHRVALEAAGVWLPGADEGTPAARRDPAGPAALAGEHLTIGHDGQALRTLEVAIPAGVSTVITGPNGCGKTTLAMTLAGLLPPIAGLVNAAPELRPAPRRVGWRRRWSDPSDPHQWASRDLLTRIGTVFAEPEHQFVAATVADEIAVGLRALGVDPAARVAEMLGQLRLEHLAGANPFTLSGGEKRRLSVATVLATAPQVLVLDEPTFGQDRTTWLALVALVAELEQAGHTVISVTHDPAYITRLGSHRLALEAV